MIVKYVTYIYKAETPFGDIYVERNERLNSVIEFPAKITKSYRVWLAKRFGLSVVLFRYHLNKKECIFCGEANSL